tara:strand:+ start:939 stop:1100 length:162 start_codon:yes stop_codon:yes gene_type:complete
LDTAQGDKSSGQSTNYSPRSDALRRNEKATLFNKTENPSFKPGFFSFKYFEKG